jgi:hypothetical protein
MPFRPVSRCIHASERGTIFVVLVEPVGTTMKKCGGELLTPRHGSRTPIARKACDKAKPPCLVVLHLRARYVSKAAILTLPIRFVSVENRSPA